MLAPKRFPRHIEPMGASPFFDRIRADVLAMTASIPMGSVTSFADIGGHIDVMPRHIAYILRMLDPGARAVVPWHRVVAADGRLLAALLDEQATLLAAEDIAVAQGKVVDLARHQVMIADLPHGVAARLRPADAPIARTKPRQSKA